MSCGKRETEETWSVSVPQRVRCLPVSQLNDTSQHLAATVVVHFVCPLVSGRLATHSYMYSKHPLLMKMFHLQVQC